jgi:hypothetical protein
MAQRLSWWLARRFRPLIDDAAPTSFLFPRGIFETVIAGQAGFPKTKSQLMSSTTDR